MNLDSVPVVQRNLMLGQIRTPPPNLVRMWMVTCLSSSWS